MEVVLDEVGGIVFLSGWKSNSIHTLAKERRDLQASALELGANGPKYDMKTNEASEPASELARVNGLAQLGLYDGMHTPELAKGDFYGSVRDGVVVKIKKANEERIIYLINWKIRNERWKHNCCAATKCI